MDKLDQLHVVSDLHLGGVPGHQVCNQGAALAAVIDHLATVAPEQRVGLVLNGDIVDFLAAENAEHFDPTGAIAKLQAIFDDDAFAPVWAALARFVATEHRLLVLVIGNHDVELALPHVQEHLLARLSGESTAARGRVRMAMDGTGFACTVGGRRALCIHGNDVDPWNTIDQRGLRAAAKAINESVAAPELEPNAGTRLVIDVLNGIKRTHPFVDLLKPETATVPSVLLALPEHLHPPLLEFARITLRLAYDKAHLERGFLGGAGAAVPGDGYRALALLVQRDAAAPGAATPRAADTAAEGVAWLQGAQKDFAGGLRPAEVVGLGRGDDMLGLGDLARDKIFGTDPRDDLRKALATYLAGDRTFRFDTEDAAFRAHDAEVGPEVSFVVTGHTHLCRRLPRARGNGVYFNTGTWIRLLRIPEASLVSREAFEPLYRALTSGRLADLDDVDGLVVQPRVVVSIWAEGREVHGELRRGLPAAAPGAPSAEPPWEAVTGTRFTLTSLEG